MCICCFREAQKQLVERPRAAPQQHERPRRARIGHAGYFAIRRAPLEGGKGLVKMAQEMMRRIAEDRVLLHARMGQRQ